MKKLIVIFSVFFLVSCHQQLSHLYLLQHPDELAKERYRCETATHVDDTYCLMVKRTEEDFVGLATVRQASPEQFGQQILESQTQLALMSDQLKKIPAGSTEFKALQGSYQQQVDKINTLLAVVRATSFRE